MGSFNMNYNEQTIKFVRNLLNRETKEVTAKWLIESVYSLYKANLLNYEIGAWERGDTKDCYFRGTVDVNCLFDLYTYTYASVAKQLMRLVVTEFNITRFNFNGCGDKYIDDNYVIFDRWLEETPYPKKITLVGNFIQKRAISSSLQNCLPVVDVEGKFILVQGYSKEIELPEKCILKNFYVQADPFSKEATFEFFKDVTAYRNRESRLTRLAKQKSVRDLVKQANTSGVLTFTDNYGIPLEKGCLVAFSNYSCRLGTVVGQTSKKIQVIDINSGLRKPTSVSPHEIVRII